eukprot:snap_masked-scaffold_99-processed-gene-0.12-mRNA-1 protein AED:1.00 eAED:1.00 QI:0/0/0/0/1/1/2/0/66
MRLLCAFISLAFKYFNLSYISSKNPYTWSSTERLDEGQDKPLSSSEIQMMFQVFNNFVSVLHIYSS